MNLFEILIGFFSEELTAKTIFENLFESEIKKFGNQFNPQNLLKGLFKQTPISQLHQKLNSLHPKLKKELFEKFNSFNKNKTREQDKTEFILFSQDEKISLSSSFLQYGIFTYKGNDVYKGSLTIAIGGKEYDLGEVRTAIWASMVQAKGSNGTGAGSVLWNTIWWNRRTKTKLSGGVVGTVETLIKRKRQVYAQIARNTKTIHIAKKAMITERATQIKKAMFSRRAKLARKA